MRQPNEVPTKPTLIRFPKPIRDYLEERLYSELEGRVPHGEYSRYLSGLIEADQRKTASLAKFDSNFLKLNGEYLTGKVAETQLVAKLFRLVVEYLQDSKHPSDTCISFSIQQFFEAME